MSIVDEAREKVEESEAELRWVIGKELEGLVPTRVAGTWAAQTHAGSGHRDRAQT